MEKLEPLPEVLPPDPRNSAFVLLETQRPITIAAHSIDQHAVDGGGPTRWKTRLTVGKSVIASCENFPDEDFWGISVTSGDPLLSRILTAQSRIIGLSSDGLVSNSPGLYPLHDETF